MATQRICSIPGCGKPVRCRHLCESHYRAGIKAGMPVRRHAKKGDGQAFVEAAYRSMTEQCVIWPFTEKSSYGTMRIDGRHIQPHRYACILQNGPPASIGLIARHICNNRRCVNPRHMLWGTDQDNMDDKIRSGNCHRGEQIVISKLTTEIVLAIRASEETHRALAKKYGVSDRSIFNVRKRLTWKHI